MAGQAFFSSFASSTRLFYIQDLYGRESRRIVYSFVFFFSLFYFFCPYLSAKQSVCARRPFFAVFLFHSTHHFLCRCKSSLCFCAWPKESFEADHAPIDLSIRLFASSSCSVRQTLTYTAFCPTQVSRQTPFFITTLSPERPIPRPLKKRTFSTHCSSIFFFLVFLASLESMDIKWQPLLHPTVG